MTIELSQKRIWYAREQLMGNLASLGMPAGVMDGSHVLIRGVKQLATWLVTLADPRSFSLVNGESENQDKALALFSAACPFKGADVMMVAPTGVSIMEGRAVIDGCALRVATGHGDAFVIPVSRNALADGHEYTEIIAMVPLMAMKLWTKATSASIMASRSLEASRRVMRVYNGQDIKIDRVTTEDLVLAESVKSSFMDDITGFLGRRKWYGDRGLPWKMAYLLVGPPGTGKTSLARWAASELDVPTMSLDFTDPYADGRTLSGCLAAASAMAPCILVLDDIDKVIGGQNRSGMSVHAIQTGLSGMGSMDGIIIIATCNSTQLIRGTLGDGSENPLARRFDRIIEVVLPDGKLRSRYAAKLLAKDGFDETSTSRFFGGQNTDGWSFDDVRAAITAAANITSRRGDDRISPEDVDMGVVSTTQRRGSRSVDPSFRMAPSESEDD